MKRFIPFLVLALALTAAAARADQTAGDPGSPVDLAAVPVPALDLDAAGAGDRLPVYPKLDAALAEVVAPSGRDRESAAAAKGLRLEDGRVQARLVVAEGAEAAARAAVADAGGEVTGELDNVLQVWLPPERLQAVAGSAAVSWLGAPDYAVPAEPAASPVRVAPRPAPSAGVAVSEGVALTNAAAWHAAGARGQGQRIAIIDAGFQGYPALLGGELPAEVVAKNFVDGQPDAEVDATTRHGTACAEIVHDMAPDSALYLIKIATDVDLAQAVDYAIAQGVDVISTSLTFVNVTPGDGTGKFAVMTQRAADAGILWVTAAGNYREDHWAGRYADSDGDGIHEFAPGVEVNVFGPGNNTAFQIPAGYALSIALRWDDWTAVREDYRLLLVRYNGTTFETVATANNPQTGAAGQRPTERVNYVTTGGAAIYGVAIQRVSGARPVYFDLLTPNRELDRRVTTMSLGNLADAPAALTVGAVGSSAPHALEAYSSEGPTNGPGGAPAGGFLKPDLVAFANISTASYGTRAFSGTSAATPHVAGAAALVGNAYPTFGPAQIRFYLEESSIDQGPACVDAQFGYGRLFLRPSGQLLAGYRLALPFVVRGADRC